MTDNPSTDVQIDALSHDLRVAPWRVTLLHSTPAPRLFWMTHGQGRVILGPRLFGVGVHNVIFVPANEPIALDPGPGMNGQIVTLPVRTHVPWPLEPQLLRLRDVSSQADVAAMVEAITRETRNSLPHQHHAMRFTAELMAIWLSRHCSLDQRAAMASTASDRLISAFLALLERRFALGQTLSDYAEQLDVTPTHLSRVCKSHLGHTGADLIAARTLHAARLELETGTHAVQSIAHSLGFGSAAYFSRFIQAHTGSSPRDLRKNAQAKSRQS